MYGISQGVKRHQVLRLQVILMWQTSSDFLKCTLVRVTQIRGRCPLLNTSLFLLRPADIRRLTPPPPTSILSLQHKMHMVTLSRQFSEPNSLHVGN